jgi:hypothetical protein
MRDYLGTRSVAPDVVRVTGVLPIPLRRLWPLALAFAMGFAGVLAIYSFIEACAATVSR